MSTVTYFIELDLAIPLIRIAANMTVGSIRNFPVNLRLTNYNFIRSF